MNAGSRSTAESWRATGPGTIPETAVWAPAVAGAHTCVRGNLLRYSRRVNRYRWGCEPRYSKSPALPLALPLSVPLTAEVVCAKVSTA